MTWTVFCHLCYQFKGEIAEGTASDWQGDAENVFRRKHEGRSGKEKSEKVQRYFLLTSVNSDIEKAVKPCQKYCKYWLS